MEPRDAPSEPGGAVQRWVTWLLVLAIVGQLVWLTARYAGKSPSDPSSAVGLESSPVPVVGQMTPVGSTGPDEDPEAPPEPVGSVPPPPPSETDARGLLFGDRSDADHRMETLAAVLVALQGGPGLPVAQRRQLAEACRPYFAAAAAEKTAVRATMAALDERQQERIVQSAAEPMDPDSLGHGPSRLSEALAKRTGGKSRPSAGKPVPPELEEALSADTLFLAVLGLETKGPALTAAQAEEIYGAVQAYERCRQEQERHELALLKLLTEEQLLWLRAHHPERGHPSAIPFLVEEWLQP